MAAKPDEKLIGQTVAGRYEVLRLIGRGGMGAIYEVRHTKLARHFALKTLAARLAGDPEALARFRREADVVATLRHPNVVEIVDWEVTPDGEPCMVMELLRGGNLAERIAERGALPWPEVLRIGDQILAGLTVAHRAGVVHRDLKPENVFLAVDDAGEEHAKLLDFGVSKIRHADSLVTGDDRLIGTPAYMSPEQADGRSEDVGPATDAWAMGAILFEMATGKQAFVATSTPSVLYRICHAEHEPLAPARADAPAKFAEVVDRALSSDPARRLGGAAEMRRLLRGALAGVSDGPAATGAADATERLPRITPDDRAERPPPAEPIATRPTTLSRATGQLGRDGQGARRAWLLGAALAGVVAVGGWLILRSPHGPASDPPTTPSEAPAAKAPPPEAAPTITPIAPAPPIAVVGLPHAAVLTLDGDPVDPARVAVPSDGRAHLLRASAPGFVDAIRQVTAGGPSLVQLDLHRRGPRPAPPAAKHAPASVGPLDP